MKQILYYTIAVALLLASLTPAMAQGQGGMQRPFKPKGILGEVTGADARRGMVQITLTVMAASPDAPGKVPDKMARQAAELTDYLNQLQQMKNRKPALELDVQKTISNLLSWREVPIEIRTSEPIPVVSAQLVSINAIPKGMHVQMQVVADGNSSGAVPNNLRLVSNILQAGPRAPLGIQPIQKPRITGQTFFMLVGEVTSTAPLTLNVGNQTVQVDVTPQSHFLQLTPQTLRDLTPGTQVLVRGEPVAGRINGIWVINGNDMSILKDIDAMSILKDREA